MRASKYLEALFICKLMASIILEEGSSTLHAYFIQQAPEDTGDLAEVGRLASDRQGWSTHSQHPVQASLLSTLSPTNKSLGKEIKSTRRDHFTPIRMAIFKTQKKQRLASVNEDVEKLDPLCAAGGNVKWCSHCGKQ